MLKQLCIWLNQGHIEKYFGPIMHTQSWIFKHAKLMFCVFVQQFFVFFAFLFFSCWYEQSYFVVELHWFGFKSSPGTCLIDIFTQQNHTIRISLYFLNFCLFFLLFLTNKLICQKSLQFPPAIVSVELPQIRMRSQTKWGPERFCRINQQREVIVLGWHHTCNKGHYNRDMNRLQSLHLACKQYKVHGSHQGGILKECSPVAHAWECGVYAPHVLAWQVELYVRWRVRPLLLCACCCCVPVVVVCLL